MVIEDEIGPRESLRLLLNSRGYSNLHFAPDGLDALAQLQTLGSSIYLILTDLRMPRMDGMTFVKRLADEHAHSVGVVGITGFPTPEADRSFRDLGKNEVLALDFLGKPYDSRALVERVAQWLDCIHEHRRVQDAGRMPSTETPAGAPA